MSLQSFNSGMSSCAGRIGAGGEKGGGTEVRDAVEYGLPLGLLGRLAHLLLVRRKLETTFDYRHRVIEEIFGKPLQD